MLEAAAVLCAILVLAAASVSAAEVAPLPESVEPYPVVADIAFAEGPIFDQAGNLYFVNYHTLGTIGRRAPDGTVSVWVHTGGQANGLKVDGAGNIIVADYGAKRITRIHPITRKLEVLTDSYEGKPYLGPNDVCLDLAGNIYFTDPTGSSKEKPIGAVYRISFRGSDLRSDSPAGGRTHGVCVTRLADGLAFPNGLAVSPDQKRLYVAESGTNRLLCWDLQPDGTLANQRVILAFPNDTLDGIMFDAAGRLWIARWTNKTVDVVDVDKGVLLKSYPAGGDEVSNLCWWGTNLYVTVAGQHSIHRLEVGVKGAEIVPAR